MDASSNQWENEDDHAPQNRLVNCYNLAIVIYDL